MSQQIDTQVLRLPHRDECICWFTILPHQKAILCKDSFCSKFSILDPNTLMAKRDLSVNDKLPNQPVSQIFPDGVSYVIPGFETVEIRPLIGSSRTILIELIWSRGTQISTIQTSSVDLKKNEVTAINQLTLPVFNDPNNWCFDMKRDNDRKDHFYCMFYWHESEKTALSLARICVTSKSGDIKCEALINQRIIGDHHEWSTRGAFVSGNNVYLLKAGGEKKKMLRHSLDGTRTTRLTLKPFLGKYPLDGYMVEGWFEGYWIAFICPRGSPGQLWALDVAARQWLNLGVMISEHMPCGPNKLEISKEGKAYLLARCADRCPDGAHVYTFHIKYRLAKAREAIQINPRAASASAPPPYSTKEVESMSF